MVVSLKAYIHSRSIMSLKDNRTCDICVCVCPVCDDNAVNTARLCFPPSFSNVCQVCVYIDALYGNIYFDASRHKSLAPIGISLGEFLVVSVCMCVCVCVCM